jgi:hypothetical protein
MMSLSTEETIENLLINNISRELIMGIEDALITGANRAFIAAEGMDDGHLPHVLGQMRHFHMNEAFHRTLSEGTAAVTPIKGNGVISGRSGLFTLARFNTSESIWSNARRSKSRRLMSTANRALEPLVQPGLFDNYERPNNATVFFVSCFSGSLKNMPEVPIKIQIAVPDKEMKGWLFREDIPTFLARYDVAITSVQEDKAKPSLKRKVSTKNGSENYES